MRKGLISTLWKGFAFTQSLLKITALITPTQTCPMQYSKPSQQNKSHKKNCTQPNNKAAATALT
jgi:hypothetical protein